MSNGTAAATVARKREPVDYPETPAAAPAAPEKSSPVKPAPSAKKEPKTASVAPASATVVR